jgi:predicted SprT family Zn-dependent metalloprotease
VALHERLLADARLLHLGLDFETRGQIDGGPFLPRLLIELADHKLQNALDEAGKNVLLHDLLPVVAQHLPQPRLPHCEERIAKSLIPVEWQQPSGDVFGRRERHQAAVEMQNEAVLLR